MHRCRGILAVGILVVAGAAGPSVVTVSKGWNPPAFANRDFHVDRLPRPWRDDAAAKATFSLVSGTIDTKSGGLAKLNDGNAPTKQDEPAENFFFAERTPGGRVLCDLGAVIAVGQINTFSWHVAERSAQVYKVYASDGRAANFNAKPTGDGDLIPSGWTLIAAVDTRPRDPSHTPGQYAVSLAREDGAPLGRWRYLLFDVACTDPKNGWSNTFFSEIDVTDAEHPPTEPLGGPDGPVRGDRVDPDGL